MAQRVSIVKEMLLNEVDIASVLDEFFDRVADEPAFLLDFHAMGHSWLHDAIARACENILDQPEGSGHVSLLAIPAHELVHGSVVFDGYMGIALFFEDISMGAIGLYADDDPSRALLARLVCTKKSSLDSRYGPN